VVSSIYIFSFQPLTWGRRWSHFDDHIFSDGLELETTNQLFIVSWIWFSSIHPKRLPETHPDGLHQPTLTGVVSNSLRSCWVWCHSQPGRSGRWGSTPYGGFLKWWVSPTTIGFPTKKWPFWGVKWGYHYFRNPTYGYPNFFEDVWRMIFVDSGWKL